MKNLFIALFSILFTNVASSQQSITSGTYYDGLNLAYDPDSKLITGFFESYVGEEDANGNPRFSCLFYIEGTLDKDVALIHTYYTDDMDSDMVDGYLKVTGNKTVEIKLGEDHGGCWNVQHFKTSPVKFELEKSNNWIQVRYINSEKSYFHKEKSSDQKLKSYLVKGDVVYIEKFDGEWAYCYYYGKKTTQGWMKITDLNKFY
ncbi:hypothetical protein [Flavobacterium pedocola]